MNILNITKNRKTWFTISGIAVVASLLLSLTMGYNLGLDFTGGARWQVQFGSNEAADVITAEGADVTATVAPDTESVAASDPGQPAVEAFFASRLELTQDAKIQNAGNGEYLITIEDLEDVQLQNIRTDMANSLGDFTEINYRKVDSSIGKTFQRKSVIAILFALAGIIITIAISFWKVPRTIGAWRFGVVAIVALFHDIIIILGIFAVLSAVTGLELDLQFITALLATLGFSVNDTIVILDRVRENIGRQKASETFEETIEKSVQQTLLRSIFTSISTLLPLIGLLLFGAQSIFYFVLALALGIAIGTWSSIFLAAPLLATWKERINAKSRAA